MSGQFHWDGNCAGTPEYGTIELLQSGLITQQYAKFEKYFSEFDIKPKNTPVCLYADRFRGTKYGRANPRFDVLELYCYADANLQLPRSRGCYMVGLNGAWIEMKSNVPILLLAFDQDEGCCSLLRRLRKPVTTLDVRVVKYSQPALFVNSTPLRCGLCGVACRVDFRDSHLRPPLVNLSRLDHVLSQQGHAAAR